MPIAALIALQSTVVAIKQGCQMLRDGRAEIGKLKKAGEDTADKQQRVRELDELIKKLYSSGKPDDRLGLDVAAGAGDDVAEVGKRRGQVPLLDFDLRRFAAS